MKKILAVIFAALGATLLAFAVSGCASHDTDISVPLCKDGKSAYEIYAEEYIAANGSNENLLSEEEWLKSLKGETGVNGKDGTGIERIETVCGNIIVYYNDNTSTVLENMLPDAGHNWNDGEITINPTCITLGIITFTCDDCGAVKKEPLEPNGEHRWSGYDYDEKSHWRTCRICGEADSDEHGFTEVSEDGDLDSLIECECGIHKTVGELFSYRVNFEVNIGSVLVYDSQNYDEGGYSALTAYSRSKDGKLLKDGEGQVNFELVVPFGYTVDINVTPSYGYKNLKGVEETGRENTYRITKITSNLTVEIDIEIETLSLPVMLINTEGGASVTDKVDYMQCNVSVINSEAVNCFDSVSAGIRIRGNSTSSYPKKPYRIKFDSKQNLFGIGKYKSWVLLALYQDFSNIKDYAAFDFAESIKNENSKAFVPKAQHVEVYLNGEYSGLYLLTEQIQENEGRVGVEEEFDETLIEVPFLVEWDEYVRGEGVEGVDWFVIDNKDSGVKSYYAIKYPEPDQRYTQEQFDYIKKYIEKVNSLCHDPDVTREQFEEYIDLQSFIDYYLIQEFMGQGEINWKSIYMSKAIDGKLVMGPVWDFDWSATGPISYGSTWGPTGWNSKTNWFAYMKKVDWFFDEICTRWIEIVDVLRERVEALKDFKSEITAEAERNAVLWDFIDDGNPVNDFDGYYDKVINFFEKRLIWLDSEFNANAS